MADALAYVLVGVVLIFIVTEVIREAIKEPAALLVFFLFGLCWIWGYCILEFLKIVAKAFQ